MRPIEYLPGDSHRYIVWANYVADFPVGYRGLCAFCHGDPCAEHSHGLIATYR